MSSANTRSMDTPGSLSGSIMMVASCCIGAGMIGLPVITAVAGLLPTIFVLSFLSSFLFFKKTSLDYTKTT